MKLKLLFLFLFFSISTLVQAQTQSQPPLFIEIEFPFGKDSFFNIQMYRQGTIGSLSSKDIHKFSLPAKIIVANTTNETLSQIKIKFDLTPPLKFDQSKGEDQSKNLPAQSIVWEIPELRANESTSFLLHIKPPQQKEIAFNKKECALWYSYRIQTQEALFNIKESAPILLRNPKNPLLTLTITLIGPIGLLLLLVFGRYQKLFSHYTTAEIVTLAIFISFFGAGSVFTQIFKIIGVPYLLINFIWNIYAWILIMSLIQLIPKKGVILIYKLGSALLVCTLIWGFNPVQLITHTIAGAICLEIWFRLTGFGRTFFSAIGAALAFFIYPVCFFWLFVTPILYHHFYSKWFIQIWLGFDLITYLAGAIIGYFFSKRLVKILR